MEPKGYELLKIETKIDALEKELSALFADFKKYESKKDIAIENPAYQKLQKMNVCCLNLLETSGNILKILKKICNGLSNSLGISNPKNIHRPCKQKLA